MFLWFGHTHAHKTCASDLWVEGIHTTSRNTAGCAGPHIYPLTATERKTLRNTTSYILQQGFTAIPARCWAALYGVDCLRVRAEKAVSVLRAPPPGMLVSCLGKRRDHSGRHRQSPTFVPTKSLQNSCFIGRASPNCRHFIVHLKKIPTKVPQVYCTWYRRCAE